MAKDFDTCGKCGQALQVGAWPFCPHEMGAGAVIGDDIPGGLIIEHIFPGRKVYSKSELKRVIGSKGYMLDDTKTEHDFARIRKESEERAGDLRRSQER